jgi:hypothetical protein
MSALVLLKYLWVLPNSLLGLIVTPLALLGGGSATVVDGVLEVHGGLVTRMLRVGLPWVGASMAITLGHVVLGCDAQCLERSRRHERVHVRQYECWGPLFIPLYLVFSAWAFVRGGDAYRDNPFERQAYSNDH